jgi:hypothetical protein
MQLKSSHYKQDTKWVRFVRCCVLSRYTLERCLVFECEESLLHVTIAVGGFWKSEQRFNICTARFILKDSRNIEWKYQPLHTEICHVETDKKLPDT